MGIFTSKHAKYSFPFLHCTNHSNDEALAFCANHKILVCLSCILNKIHFGQDCDMLEIRHLTANMLGCLILRKEIINATEKITGTNIEMRLKQEIDDACEKEIERIQATKIEMYAKLETRLTKIRASSSVNNAEILELLERLFGVFRLNQHDKAEALVSELEKRSYCTDVDYEPPENEQISSGAFQRDDKNIDTSFFGIENPLKGTNDPDTSDSESD